MQKQYQTKVESYQDFYRNVKSYKHFDREKHWNDLLVRKEEDD